MVLKHTVNWLFENDKYKTDIVAYLQITDVFRSKDMIDDCIEVLLERSEVDTVFMGLVVHKNF